METSAVCVRHLVSSSIVFSPFSDQTHVDFYHLPSSTSRALPSFSLRSFPSRGLLSASSRVSPLRALCESACPVLEPDSEQASLMKELADLKLQMKQKKKELKAQKKDEKKRLKLQVKEEKKAMKPKDVTDVKKKKKCQFESSSSESSDGECESMSMRTLRQESSLLSDSERGPARVQADGNAVDVCEGSCGKYASVALMESSNETMSYDSVENSSLNANAGSISSEKPKQTDMQTNGVSSAIRCPPLNSASVQAPNRIEVCAGGKCKKAGSEHFLSSLCAQIPSSSNVVAVPCKCMGKCSMTLNVKVHKEDTNPQHHSHVRVEDANFILNHHFGLGCPPTGLPSLPSQDRSRVLLPMSA